jgi:capsular exopolysaccharide synthesis family protein
MDLRSYLRAIRKSWWIVVLVVVLGAAAGFGFSKAQTSLYEAKLTFYVAVPAPADTNPQSTNQFAVAQATTYAKLVSSSRLADLVQRASGVPLSSSTIAGELSGSAELNTALIDVSVQDSSQAHALTLAKSVATQFPVMVTELQKDAAKTNLSVTSGPSVSTSPVSPRTKLNVGLGAIAGLIVGLAIAVLRYVLDTSLRTADELRELTEAPVLAEVDYDPAARKAPLVLDGAARSRRAEAFRQLRTNLQFVDAARPAGVIVITSPVANEGKSTTSANLALLFTEAGRRVLLIEADLRRPNIAEYLNIEGGVGLTNVLAGQVTLDQAIQRWGDRGLAVLPAGTIPPNPSELLNSRGMSHLMTLLRGQFDTIIIDTPPVLPVTDAAVATSFADGVVLVVRHGKTARNQVRHAVEALGSVDARLLGTVLSMRPPRGRRGGAYAGYGYATDQAFFPAAPLPTTTVPPAPATVPSAPATVPPAAVGVTPAPGAESGSAPQHAFVDQDAAGEPQPGGDLPHPDQPMRSGRTT